MEVMPVYKIALCENEEIFAAAQAVFETHYGQIVKDTVSAS
jgi:hypothetical protein